MRLHLSNSVTDEEAIVYLATELSPGEMALEDTEDIQVSYLPLQQAIDMAAMRSGASETDAYLDEWRRQTSEVDGDLAEIADSTQKTIETEYDQDRLKVLIANGGHATA